MKIVLLSGKQGSGKTSVQKQLCQSWPYYSSATLNFADILYEMHDEVLKVLHKYREPRDIVKDGPLLQLLGTEWGRKTLGENIWVDLLRSRVMRAPASQLCVIGDARFENEFDAFPEALRVRLHCPEGQRKMRCSMWRENVNHPSEIGLDAYADGGKFDLFINTSITPVSGCVELIKAQLLKNSWIEKRIDATR